MIKSISRGYQYLAELGGYVQSPLLLICRLYWGWHFVLAGWPKLHNVTEFADFLSNVEFPAPLFSAFLVGLTETLGGLCLMVGLASRFVAIILSINMVMAYILAHSEALSMFFVQPSLFVAESPFNYLLICLIVFAFGPGTFSLDYVLGKNNTLENTV